MYATKVCENLIVCRRAKGLSCHTARRFIAYLGGMFVANMEGVGKTVFMISRAPTVLTYLNEFYFYVITP